MNNDLKIIKKIWRKKYMPKVTYISSSFLPLCENRDLIIGNVSGKNADCKVK